VSLAFKLLGDVAVLADGHPLDLGGARQRSVLALLVLQRNRTISTEQLADRLWPEEQPVSAIKTIQAYVSRLRRAFGRDARRLTSSATGYRLTIADDELDVARFERGLRLSREALAHGSPGTALDTLESVLALWSGDALADLANEPFARREVGRLEELRLQAIEERAELRIGAGEGRETIVELRHLLGDRPDRERLWRLLMLALYADGRQREALEAYQDARRYLADELGLDPGKELQELEHAILTQEIAGPLVGSPEVVASAHRATAFHGASDETTGGTASLTRRTRRVVTVLCADVARSPGEDDLDPEILELLERRAQDGVRSADERHGGTIEQAAHDRVIAVFGLVVAREDDALRAVRAAIELTTEEASTEVPGPVYRLGVATGVVLAGLGEPHGPMLTGPPLQLAEDLAARAAPMEVLLAADTERLVRAMASTEKTASDATQPSLSTAVRLVSLIDGDAVPRRAGTPFVGRQDELVALRVAFDRIVAVGAPGLATVIGAPGVGKSRLVAESFALIADRALILRSRCLPYGDGITYWPIRDLVVAATGIGGRDLRDDALARLGSAVAGIDAADRIRSVIASIIGLVDDPVPREEIPWAVRRFFEALARKRPLVLVVDDVQWAEPALLDLLEHVLDLGRGPILVIAIARPELDEVRSDWLTRPHRLVINLDALGHHDAETMLDHLAPELPPGLLRSRILDAAEGNPLFVEQFVSYMSDGADADSRATTERTSGDLAIPLTIGALLAARLDRLPSGERLALERAAVVGRTFWTGALAQLLPVGERAALPRRLARLARRDLIRPDRSGFENDDAFRFRHLLIRDAAYAALPKRDRAKLHERFADWLERRANDIPRGDGLILGYHLEQAYTYRVEVGDDPAEARGLADRALESIAPAGLAALERGDPHAAASLLRRAVSLSGPGRRRIELLLDLRAALRTAGNRSASEAVDAEAVALLAIDPDEGLEHRHRLAEAQFAGAGPVSEIDDAYAYYERTGDRLGMIRTLETAFVTHANHGQFTEAVAQLDRATAIALEIGRPDRAAAFSARVAHKLPDSPVPVPKALRRCRRYLDLAGDNREAQATILLNIGELEWRNGVGDRWRRHFDAAKAIIDDFGLLHPLGSAIYPIMYGDAELAAGEPNRSLELLRWSCVTLEHLGDIGHLGTAAPLTGQTLLALGRLDEVEQYAYWGRDVADPADLDAHSRWRNAMSGLRSRQGRHDEAVALARESVALLSASEFTVSQEIAHLVLADALRAAGDEAGAMAAAHEARGFAAAKEDRAVLATIRTFLAAAG
jgi:predicted ATPase/DNA-binding SARP family transcriptional activator